jgi:hypothetical protein
VSSGLRKGLSMNKRMARAGRTVSSIPIKEKLSSAPG